MIEIFGSAHLGDLNQDEVERIRALEELYVSATLGATFRNFSGGVKRARVRFTAERGGVFLCEIELDTNLGVLSVGACGSSRPEAFTRSSEQLDRRLHARTSAHSHAGELSNERDLPDRRMAA